MKKFIKLHIFIFLTLTFTTNIVFGMEEKKIVEYRSFEGKEINAATIGAFALNQTIPEEVRRDVSAFQEEYKELIAHLLDSSSKNSDYKEVRRKNIEAIKAAGLDFVGRDCNVFPLPNNRNLFFQSSCRLYQVLNRVQEKDSDLYCKFWSQGLTAEEIDSCPESTTLQTVSRFGNFIRYVAIANEHNLTDVIIPTLWLFQRKNADNYQEWHDGNSFIIQERMPKGCVLVKENKHRLNNISPKAFKELMIAAASIPFWDLMAKLYITPDNKFVVTNPQQGSNRSREDFLRNGVIENNDIACAFEGLYKLCSENPQLQKRIQKFVRKKVNLAEVESNRLVEQQNRLFEVVGLKKNE